MSDIDDFLREYSPPMATTAQRLRTLVMRATPTAVERLRPGWRLIGYDIPNGRRLSYFAWIWPQPDHNHVHVGWQTGILMRDPQHLLEGANLKLKKVRYLTFTPGDKVDAKLVVDFTREAARIATMNRDERELLARQPIIGH
jgi:hypothetical protein